MIQSIRGRFVDDMLIICARLTRSHARNLYLLQQNWKLRPIHENIRLWKTPWRATKLTTTLYETRVRQRLIKFKERLQNTSNSGKHSDSTSRIATWHISSTIGLLGSWHRNDLDRGMKFGNYRARDRKRFLQNILTLWAQKGDVAHVLVALLASQQSL